MAEGARDRFEPGAGVERFKVADFALAEHQHAARTQVRVKHDHGLLVKLLPLLTIAGAVGLVLKAFTRLGLNYTRCENVKNIGNELCASPPGSGSACACSREHSDRGVGARAPP